MQSLALDVKVLDKDNNEIDLKQTFDDDDDIAIQNAPDEETEFENVTVESDLDGYGVEEPEDLGADLFNDNDDIFGDDEDDLPFDISDSIDD